MLKNNDMATIHFTCSVEDRIIDNTYDRDPLKIVIGSGNLVEGVEESMVGMNIGEKREIVISKENAFGDIDESLLQTLPLEKIPVGAVVGDIIEGSTEDGTNFQCILREIREDLTVLLDFNHPLAGNDLVFNIELIAIEAI